MAKSKNLLQTQIIAMKLNKKLQHSSYGFSVSEDLFVGLPATGMNGKWVQLTVEPEGPAAVVPVGHVGPWNGGGWSNKYDDKYWKGRRRPQAESGIDLKGRRTNRTGMLISSALWKKLGLGKKTKTMVRWQLVAAPKTKQPSIVNY